ncbi:hypothetical protein COPCOM_01042 [Coprococcus comes ATCC 27758]|uniref:Uncharacterized protein n=1 Tax=Coprococcus comes ATCC 27758 TaxID=470146 RepID=C0B7C2_9FIRM|nr:hypothetical protein COPCOM_01042 [Coprococcus comes ATCC 27758]
MPLYRLPVLSVFSFLPFFTLSSFFILFSKEIRHIIQIQLFSDLEMVICFFCI